jgi:HAD superfamily hydrolase (TIGR01509 family)
MLAEPSLAAGSVRPMTVDAVVFDLDGVLIDSEPEWEQVRKQFVLENGGRWPDEAQSRLMGMSTAEWARYLSQDLGVGQPDADVAELVIDRMAERYRRHLPLMPGALDAVDRLSARWQLGLASSSPRALIDLFLSLSGRPHAFSVTVSADEVARGKPAPDVYVTAVQELGVAVGRCLAVEDSTNGVRAAVAAGLRCAVVPRAQYPVDPAVLQSASAVLRSLDELTAEMVEEL